MASSGGETPLPGSDTSKRLRDIDNIVDITRDQLPPEVEEARKSPDAEFGKYVLLKELGRGGTGFVRKAWDTLLGRFVALKFIHFEKPSGIETREAELEEEDRVRNLITEARVAARFQHPHIVPVHDVGRVGDDYYISMQYIEGESLHACINASRSRGWVSPLYEEPAHFLGLLRDVAGAIDYAHTFQRPVVHCDLKPSNILLDTARVGYVVDFGLARVVEKGRDEMIGIRGTPAFMAPEQLTGFSSDLGVFTDVYGFGGVLYVMLAGTTMFGGTPAEIVDQVPKKPPVRPSVVVRAQKKSAERMWSSPILPYLYHLEEICLRCVAKRPEDRHRSAAMVAEDLQGVLDLLQGGGPRKAAVRLPEAAAAPAAPSAPEAALSAETVALFRARLAEKVNSRRPTVADFTRESAGGGTVQILKATPARLYVLRRGVVQLLDWTELPTALAVSLADTVGMAAPEDRLALGILAAREGQTNESTRFLDSLKGTPLEETSKKLIGSVGAGEAAL